MPAKVNAVVWSYGYCLVSSFTGRHSSCHELYGGGAGIYYFATDDPPVGKLAFFCLQGASRHCGLNIAARRWVYETAKIQRRERQWAGRAATAKMEQG